MVIVAVIIEMAKVVMAFAHYLSIYQFLYIFFKFFILFMGVLGGLLIVGF